MGEGADLLVVDDPIMNRMEALAPGLQGKAGDEWKNPLLTRLYPVGVVIVLPSHDTTFRIRYNR